MNYRLVLTTVLVAGSFLMSPRAEACLGSGLRCQVVGKVTDIQFTDTTKSDQATNCDIAPKFYTFTFVTTDVSGCQNGYPGEPEPVKGGKLTAAATTMLLHSGENFSATWHAGGDASLTSIQLPPHSGPIITFFYRLGWWLGLIIIPIIAITLHVRRLKAKIAKSPPTPSVK